MGYFEVWHKNSQKHVFVEIFLTQILSSWSYGSISVKEKLNVQWIVGNLGKDVSLSLKYLSSALKSTKIHSFRVWHKEYFVGKPSKKVCVFSFSVNFLIIFSKSVISINRKEDAPDLRIDNIIKFRYHYYNSELQKKMNNKQEKKSGLQNGELELVCH